jgi:hypothetical protein
VKAKKKTKTKVKAKKKTPAKKALAKKTPRKTTAQARKAKRLDALLDQELEDTFPASDPIELTEPGRRSRRRKAR